MPASGSPCGGGLKYTEIGFLLHYFKQDLCQSEKNLCLHIKFQYYRILDNDYCTIEWIYSCSSYKTCKKHAHVSMRCLVWGQCVCVFSGFRLVKEHLSTWYQGGAFRGDFRRADNTYLCLKWQEGLQARERESNWEKGESAQYVHSN